MPSLNSGIFGRFRSICTRNWITPPQGWIGTAPSDKVRRAAKKQRCKSFLKFFFVPDPRTSMMQFHKYLFLLSLVFTLSVATGCGDADGDSATLNNGGGAGKITTRKVAIADVYLSNARFSPDGKRFALVHDDGEVEALATLGVDGRSEEHTSELQSRPHLVC